MTQDPGKAYDKRPYEARIQSITEFFRKIAKALTPDTPNVPENEVNVNDDSGKKAGE